MNEIPAPPPGFVLDASEAEVPPPPPGFVLDEAPIEAAGDPNLFDALGYSLSQGATLGFGDEIAAGLRTGAGMWGDYGKALDQERANLNAVREEYPWISLGAEIAGGIGTGAGLAKGGLSLGANAAKAGKGWFARMLGGSADGALMAGTYGAGTGEGAADRVQGALDNIPLGIVGGAAGELLATGAGAGYRRLFKGADDIAPGVSPAQNVDDAAQFGIPLSRAQATRSVAQANIEDQLRSQGALSTFDDAQRQAVDRSVGTVHQSLAGRSPVIPGQSSAYEAIPGKLRGVRDSLRAASKEAYQASVNNPDILVDGKAVQALPGFIRNRLDADQIVIDPMYHTGASRAMQYIDDYLSRLPKPPAGRGNGNMLAPPEGELQAVSAQLRWLENMRAAVRKNYPPIGQDAPALKAISGAIDDWMDDIFDKGMVSGSDEVLRELKAARAKWSEYRSMAEPKARIGGKLNPTYEALRTVRNLMDKDLSPEEIGRYLWGSSVASPPRNSFMTAKVLKETLGPDSPEWNAVRQSFWLRATRAGDEALSPVKIAKNLDGLLNGEGKSVATIVFSPTEREMMSKYLNVMRMLSPAKGGLNNSNTANRMLPQLARYGSAIMGALSGGGGLAAGMDPLAALGLSAATTGAARALGAASRVARTAAATGAPVPVNPSGIGAGALRGGSTAVQNALQGRKPLEITVTRGMAQ